MFLSDQFFVIVNLKEAETNIYTMKQDGKDIVEKFSFEFLKEAIIKENKYDKITRNFVPNFKGKCRVEVL